LEFFAAIDESLCRMIITSAENMKNKTVQLEVGYTNMLRPRVFWISEIFGQLKTIENG